MTTVAAGRAGGVSTTMVTRAAERRDVGAVGGLLVELFTQAALGRPDLFRLPQADDPGERAALARYVTERLDAAAEKLIVAEAAGVVLGFVHVLVEQVPDGPSPPYRRAVMEGWILHIAVGAQHRRRGVGRALDAAARAWARTQGASALGLQAWSYNREALGFFVRLGYEVRSARLFGAC
ncbi:MAG: GNAT family N-acetyltransferase [Deltaproteobacteria bacterium]|nr:GNAT family N-acetyltransferase [Deltaproteobacteria bacterium]